MLRNRIYYDVKPFIPQRLRVAVRRHLARRRRPLVSDVWPIMPGSERPPEGWSGWPDGKKFAVVLTHDVEGKAGLARCRQLMELEMELGFRSSFNFIPEGNYRVPAAFRDELTRNGFEVGVHDLEHDGRLFRSLPQFQRHARRINHYLREWNAVGFRSAFMLRNLDWLHQLEIEYDLSTFDTDPFEPQPEGQHTIFPFWVPRPPAQRSDVRGQKSEDGGSAIRNSPIAPESGEGGSASQPVRVSEGYVELPYTLPQDSTLFLLLRETTIEIWKQKVDWIANHGGMILLNTHPDYMAFPNGRIGRWEYPAGLYQELLDYIASRYSGAFWHGSSPSGGESDSLSDRCEPLSAGRRQSSSGAGQSGRSSGSTSITRRTSRYSNR